MGPVKMVFFPVKSKLDLIVADLTRLYESLLIHIKNTQKICSWVSDTFQT